MNTIQNIVEYYDELYPVTSDQKKFYSGLFQSYNKPTRLLRVSCATGYFEHYLAREGEDVTGIEVDRDLLHSANLRRRSQLMSVRFFEMSSLDMTRFLGKGFYNIVSILDDKIMFIHDRTLMRKFFCDCKSMLSEGGTFVIQGVNFDPVRNLPKFKIRTRESLRSKLFTEIFVRDDKFYVNQSVETGSGKILPVMEESPVYPLTTSEIKEFAREAGFDSVQLYADYAMNPFTGSEPSYVAVIK